MQNLEISGVHKYRSGKVREVFDLGDKLLLVASDRISAFDYILKQTIPNKGKVLNKISSFWFKKLNQVIPNHVISDNIDDYPDILKPYSTQLKDRSMLVKKTQVVKLECIVRGYITGSGWKDYQKTGTVGGIILPKGLQPSQQLEAPLFTPSTKAEVGHDENVNEEQAKEIVGEKTYNIVKEKSIQLYLEARDYALTRGIIIADTKFEFGIDNGQIILIDEALTPDSSRFWPADEYQIGKEQPSFDKQFVRNYLLSLDWDMQPPVPNLPEDIIKITSEKYIEAYEKLTGTSFN